MNVERPLSLTPLMRVSAAKGTNSPSGLHRGDQVAEALGLGELEDGAPLRRVVLERRADGGCDELRLVAAGDGDELGREPVAEGDRAGLVEQEGIDVAGCLDRAPGHREHVALDQAVHPGDADGREQAADSRRDQADEERDEHDDRDQVARVVGERLQRHGHHQEDEGQAGEEDVERDLVRRLLPGGAFDEADHAVEERLAGVGGDADVEVVADDSRAAGDRAADVSAGLLEDGRGLAGDGGLVDVGHAFDRRRRRRG